MRLFCHPHDQVASRREANGSSVAVAARVALYAVPRERVRHGGEASLRMRHKFPKYSKKAPGNPDRKAEAFFGETYVQPCRVF